MCSLRQDLCMFVQRVKGDLHLKKTGGGGGN